MESPCASCRNRSIATGSCSSKRITARRLAWCAATVSISRNSLQARWRSKCACKLAASSAGLAHLARDVALTGAGRIEQQRTAGGSAIHHDELLAGCADRARKGLECGDFLRAW